MRDNTRQREVRSVAFTVIASRIYVALIVLIFSGFVTDEADASCGDYVILTGEVPDWVRQKSQFVPNASLLVETTRRTTREIAERLVNHNRRQPCHGPNCGQGKPVFSKTFLLPNLQREISSATGRTSTLHADIRDCFAKPLDDASRPLLSGNRLDRPPQLF